MSHFLELKRPRSHCFVCGGGVVVSILFVPGLAGLWALISNTNSTGRWLDLTDRENPDFTYSL